VSPNVPGAPRGKAQNKRPACALSAILWRVGPSTRGATAPQRAQQVNFVVRCRGSNSDKTGGLVANIHWLSSQCISIKAFSLSVLIVNLCRISEESARER